MAQRCEDVWGHVDCWGFGRNCWDVAGKDNEGEDEVVGHVDFR